MVVLTPAERRVAVLLTALLVLGAVTDLLDRRTAPPLDPADSAVADTGRASIPAAAPAAAVTGTSRAPCLDLNRATASELDDLPGVGPVLAGRIVEQRARLGGFRAIEDLRTVRGIGSRLLARIRPRLRLGADPADTARADPGAIPPH